MNKELTVTIDSYIATITVNRPEVKNAINLGMCADLISTLQQLDNNSKVRVVVLRGAGEMFISGADIREFEAELSTPQRALEYDRQMELVTSTLENLAKPTIAMIFRYAIGTGLLLANACDLRLSADDARFGIPAARFGLTISVPDIQRLIKLVGPAKARLLTYTGELIQADVAREIGLIHSLYPATELVSQTYELAESISRNSPVSISSMKKLLLMSAMHPHVYDVQAGKEVYEVLYTSSDLKEGIKAFFEKRKPNFLGN